ncbi:MAG: spermidine/putrescine ABC transporter permease PotB [Pseudomonadota bacterium]|nr:spermidine/putrescine ABC transporter permease PotB [Pseudomonadota bacterium]
MKVDRPFGALSIAVLWLWLLAFALVPNLMVIVASVLSRGQEEFVAFAWTLDNYRRLADPLYLAVLGKSLYLAAASTLLCLLIGYPFAWLLAGLPPRRRPWLLLLVIIPFWTSSLIRTYAMVIILKTKGVVNQTLLGLGIIDAPLDLLYTDAAVLLGLVYALLPFMVLPLYAVMEKLDRRLIEAARDLGARRRRIFLTVILPLTLPGIVAGGMLTFLPALGMFYIPDVLGGAKSLLAGNLIRDQFLTARDWPFGAAVSVMLTLLMGLLLGIYRLSARRARAEGLP